MKSRHHEHVKEFLKVVLCFMHILKRHISVTLWWFFISAKKRSIRTNWEMETGSETGSQLD